MDASGAEDERVRYGQSSRVVPPPDADPTLGSSLARTFGRASGANNKPGTPGSAKQPSKPLRRECRLFRLPCCRLRMQSAQFFARKARGCGRHPASPVPFSPGGQWTKASPGIRAAGMRTRARVNALTRKGFNHVNQLILTLSRFDLTKPSSSLIHLSNVKISTQRLKQ